MKTKDECNFCGSKTKSICKCDKCGKLTCCDCATERADINSSWTCPICNKKYKLQKLGGL